jgi:hypothetical protein
MNIFNKVKEEKPENDYFSLFLKKRELSERQSVYISKKAHTTVSKIVRMLGHEGITVGSYIDNILVQHFEMYKSEISELYEHELHKEENNNPFA